jgi:aminoglycoside/choline kinase family phosphotransferase
MPLHSESEPEVVHQSQLASLYEKRFGEPPVIIHPLKGDGSDRRIYRLGGTRHSVIGVFGPNAAENRAFLGFTRTFLEHAMPVPELFAESDDNACYLETDFGDVTLFEWQKARRPDASFPRDVFEMYAVVLSILVKFQIFAGKHVDYALCYQYPDFGEDAMWFDVRYFKEMFLDQFVARGIDHDALDKDCEKLIARLCAADRSYFLYRDFQSRNIMIVNDAPYFLDYQSGRKGALHYDAASLLYDANAQIPEGVRRRLLDGYIDALEREIPIERNNFMALFDGYAILRVMQALGAFGNLGLRKNKRRFLLSIPQALRNLATLNGRTAIMKELPYLGSVFERITADDSLLTITENYERTSC